MRFAGSEATAAAGEGEEPPQLQVQPEVVVGFSLAPGASVDLRHPLNVSGSSADLLWWPAHIEGLGPTLHSATFSVLVNATSGAGDGDSADGDALVVSDDELVRFGVRTAELRHHPDSPDAPSNLSQLVLINGRRLFVLGGNWITPDAMWRYSASEERYCDELRLHRDAGLNAVRVWGGGVAETEPFYDCADRLGLLVYQEFWMSGDNNGRWAGDYSWPLDHEAYLVNARDVVRRLRRHPSLFLYGGGNELNPSGLSPPPNIEAGLREAIAELDSPERAFITSSMDGGTLGGNQSEHDPTYALVAKDGPYGLHPPKVYFERNAGLGKGTEGLIVSFNPEAGTSAIPPYYGLERMLGEEAAAVGFPNATSGVSEGWTFHNHLPWVRAIAQRAASRARACRRSVRG